MADKRSIHAHGSQGEDANSTATQQSQSSKNTSTTSFASTLGSIKTPDFLINRRISEAEAQKRHEWLQKHTARISNFSGAVDQVLRGKICREFRFPENFHGLYSVQYSPPDGELIVCSFGTGTIQLRNGQTGELRATLRSAGREIATTSFPVMCCRFNPIYPNIIYASSACGNIFLCVADTNHFSRFIEEPKNEINAIDVSADGKYIVSGGKDATLRVYDAESAKMIHIYKRNEMDDLIDEKVEKFHRMRIFAAKFHRTYPNLIVTGGWDDTVRIWDTRVNTGSIKAIKGPHICGDALDMKDSHIITGSWVVRGSLQLWDITSCKLIDTIIPVNRPTSLDGEFLYAVQYFSGDPHGNHVLAGGSGTGALEIINIKQKKVVGSFNVTKAIMALDSIKTSIVFGGMESVIRLAEFS